MGLAAYTNGGGATYIELCVCWATASVSAGAGRSIVKRQAWTEHSRLDKIDTAVACAAVLALSVVCCWRVKVLIVCLFRLVIVLLHTVYA